MKKVFISLLIVVFVVLFFSGCFSDATVASANLSKDADMFRVYRRAVFYNGITNEYILEVRGYLSINDQGDQLEVTVKSDDGSFMKHFLGLSDNVTYFVEQIQSKYVSDDRYKVFFKPSSIVPMVEIN